jgi:hypothetical protein
MVLESSSTSTFPAALLPFFLSTGSNLYLNFGIQFELHIAANKVSSFSLSDFQESFPSVAVMTPPTLEWTSQPPCGGCERNL